MIGEFLYALSRMEAVTAPVIQRRLDNVGVSLANVAVTVDGPPVPPEKWGLLTYISIDINSGAAQTCSNFDVFIVDQAGNEQITLLQDYFAPALANIARNEGHMEVYLTPGERLRARGFFNAGAAANSVNLDAHLLLIPKGNLQLR